MTLADIIPSLRPSLPPRQLDPEIWPLTTRHGHGGLSVGGVPLMCVEQEFGTPAYIVDEADVRERCAAYAAAFGASNVVYAAKAMSCRGLLRWIDQAGLGLGVYSPGQWSLAQSVGFPPERIVVHGDVEARGAGGWSSSPRRTSPG
jgi:diaminopimelate decarboxylase